MKYTLLLKKGLIIALIAVGFLAKSQTIPPIGTLPAGKSIVITYDVTINSVAADISNQGSVSGSNFNTFNTNDPKTAAVGDPTITAVNKPPVVTATAGVTVYAHPTPVAVDNAITVTDADNPTLASATISITGNFVNGDVLAFTNDGSTMGNIAGNYVAGTGVLTLTSAGATATVAQWQAALRAVMYSSGAALTVAKTITFTASDGSTTSLPAIKLVSIPATGLALDGVDDYVITPNIFSLMPTTDLTIEVWFKANGAGVILEELGQPAPNTVWHDSQIEILGTGEVRIRVWNLSVLSLGIVSFGTWHHVALRYNSATSRFDGVLDGVTSGAFTTGVRQKPNTGALYYAFGPSDVNINMGSGAYFPGIIDEVRIWNRPLCTQEIVSNKNCELTGTQPGLLINYKFNHGFVGADNAGINTATDASGNGLNGTLMNVGLTGTASNWSIGNVSGTCATFVGDAGFHYRTIGSGNWGNSLIWEISTDNVNFSPACIPPGANAASITIRSPHVVTVSANTTAAKTTVETGGTLNVNNGVELITQ